MKKNQKRVFILSLLLIVFFLLLIIQQEYGRFTQTAAPPAFNNLTANDITEIDISDNKTTTILNKKNNTWYLKKDGIEYRADQERVQKLIDSMTSFKRQDVVSTNKNKHTELGIDKQKIGIKTKDHSYYIYIGNAAELSGSNYVRIGDENEVYTAVGFDDVFTSPDYRDLNLNLVNDESKVTNLSEKYDTTTIDLQKKNDTWTLGSTKIAHERADFFINDLKTLKADDILKKDSVAGLDKSLTIEIKENGKTKTADFYSKDKDNYIVTVSDSPYSYEVKAAYVESLKKTEKDLTE